MRESRVVEDELPSSSDLESRGERINERKTKEFEEEQARSKRVARDYFYENKARFVQDTKYRGKFLAVIGHEVVDFDEDRSALTSRVIDRFPDDVFYIGRGTKSGVASRHTYHRPL